MPDDDVIRLADYRRPKLEPSSVRDILEDRPLRPILDLFRRAAEQEKQVADE